MSAVAASLSRNLKGVRISQIKMQIQQKAQQENKRLTLEQIAEMAERIYAKEQIRKQILEKAARENRNLTDQQVNDMVERLYAKQQGKGRKTYRKKKSNRKLRKTRRV